MKSIPFYHYTENLEGIISSGKVQLGRPVIHSYDYHITEIPSGASKKKAIFGFLEPRPDSWLNNKEFPNIWNELIEVRKPDLNLLKLEIPEDKVLVLDYAQVRRDLGNPPMPMLIASYALFETKVNKNYQRYWNSRVPFKSYAGNYSLPELVFFEECLLNRVSLFDGKDFIKVQEMLKTNSPHSSQT